MEINYEIVQSAEVAEKIKEVTDRIQKALKPVEATYKNTSFPTVNLKLHELAMKADEIIEEEGANVDSVEAFQDFAEREYQEFESYMESKDVSPRYIGRTSSHWYTTDSHVELTEYLVEENQQRNTEGQHDFVAETVYYFVGIDSDEIVELYKGNVTTQEVAEWFYADATIQDALDQLEDHAEAIETEKAEIVASLDTAVEQVQNVYDYIAKAKADQLTDFRDFVKEEIDAGIY